MNYQFSLRHLAHSRCSINICWMNGEWIPEFCNIGLRFLSNCAKFTFTSSEFSVWCSTNGPWTKLRENCTAVLHKGCSLFPVSLSLKWKVFLSSTLPTLWQTGCFKRWLLVSTSQELGFYARRWTWNLKFLLTIFPTYMAGSQVEFVNWHLIPFWYLEL